MVDTMYACRHRLDRHLKTVLSIRSGMFYHCFDLWSILCGRPSQHRLS